MYSPEDLPPHLVHFRFSENGTFTVSPEAHPHTLQVRPSRVNLTGVIDTDDIALTCKTGLPFVGRRQTRTLFKFDVELNFYSREQSHEAGLSVFLTQHQYIDMGISPSNNSEHATHDFVFRIVEIGAYPYGPATTTSPDRDLTLRLPVPTAWVESGSITLQIHAANETDFVFTAFPAENPNNRQIVGYAPATVVGVGHREGQFLGTLLGVYATCHGAESEGTTCPNGSNAYFSNWRYEGVAQPITKNELVII